MTTPDPDAQRAQSAERWERAAVGWGRAADRVREFGMPVSARMIDQLELAPGQRVLELAAGPGDTGFLAAELIGAGGTLICSDASEPMLEVARERARAQGIDNIEFKRLELEWIDLPTASVDRVLCRWGIMLIVDPAAAAQEIRRVVAPGGRVAVAVWDAAEQNEWAAIPNRALVELGLAEPMDRDGPGMFALAAPGKLQELLSSAGFLDVRVTSVEIERPQAGFDAYIEETCSLSLAFSELYSGLSESQRAQLGERIDELTQPYRTAEGGLALTGRSLVAAASA